MSALASTGLGWMLARAAGLAAYLGYVALAAGAGWPLVLLALATAAGVLSVGHDRARAAGAFAAGGLVLAVYHARLVAEGDVAWASIQLGLAAAVAASSGATLLAQRTGGRVVASSAIHLAVGALVLAFGSAPDDLAVAPGMLLVAFAALRPFDVVAAGFARRAAEVG